MASFFQRRATWNLSLPITSLQEKVSASHLCVHFSHLPWEPPAPPHPHHLQLCHTRFLLLFLPSLPLLLTAFLPEAHICEKRYQTTLLCPAILLLHGGCPLLLSQTASFCQAFSTDIFSWNLSLYCLHRVSIHCGTFLFWNLMPSSHCWLLSVDDLRGTPKLDNCIIKCYERVPCPPPSWIPSSLVLCFGEPRTVTGSSFERFTLQPESFLPQAASLCPCARFTAILSRCGWSPCSSSFFLNCSKSHGLE